VQLVILTRTAAYSTPVPAFIYDELASIEHPIALRLRATQVGAIEALWRRAALPKGHADRRGLPGRCDRGWFQRTFCGGVDLSSLPANASIWPHVQSFIMYDPLALLACCGRTLETFCDPEVKVVATDEAYLRATLREDGERVRGEEGEFGEEDFVMLEQEHLVLGVTNSRGGGGGGGRGGEGGSSSGGGGGGGGGSDGIRDVHAVRAFLMNAARHALASTMIHTKIYRTGSMS
jgi:uncharacterized membrane protein YgcG